MKDALVWKSRQTGVSFHLGDDDPGKAQDRRLRIPGLLPVPEPSTWAMLLIGFAGSGFAARRHGWDVRRRQRTPI
jgi:hypothetical protein